jgi:circadian clock protein KaiB
MSADTPSKNNNYVLRLYVAGNTPQSLIAEQNLRELCNEHLAGHCHIEIIDLLQNPDLAEDDQILVVPTLVRELPTPIRKFIGTLSNPHRVLVELDIRPNDAALISS